MILIGAAIGVGARPMKFGNGAHVINKDDVIIYFPHDRSGRVLRRQLSVNFLFQSE